MIRIVRAEWRKLRRPTLLVGTLTASFFFSGLFSSLLFLLIDSPNGNSDRGRVISREILELPRGVVQGFSSVSSLLGIIALCVFAAQTAQEYSYGTLRNLLVRQPRRLLLLLGKLISMALFALVMVLTSLIASIGSQTYFAPKKDVSTEQWFTNEGRHFIYQTFGNVLLATILFGIIGMALGILLRSSITAISIAVVWILIIESLLTAVRPSVEKWLPGALLSAVGQGGTSSLEYQRSLIAALLFGVVVATISASLFAKRDVSQ